MPKSTSTEQVEPQQELEQLRTLILGEDHQLVTRAIKKNARAVVSDVLTEALHDRETKDGSVNKVLLPLVQNAVEDSVTHHSDRLISSLYPLMGSLVRKSVAAFLTDFMEKTNQLLENSLTIKGLKWRFSAWRAGISFSQYIASQTFVYRVEHVFLIHHETGLLLNSVSFDNHDNSNADVISSMLSAINDFIGDSFSQSPEGMKEQLQTVTTESFTLLLKPGPNAILVAAVTGNPPQSLSHQLQITIESLHTIYANELSEFDGDNSSFDNADNLLRDCLLAEEKSTETKKKKVPWFAWLAVTLFLALIASRINLWHSLEQLKTQLNELGQQPGVIIQHINVINNDNVEINILRDPDAITVQEWLDSKKLTFTQLTLNERLYLSLDQKLIEVKAKKITAQFKKISSQWKDDILIVTGEIDSTSLDTLLDQLAKVGIINQKNLNLSGLKVTNNQEASSPVQIKQQVFQDLIGKISTIQLSFDVSSEEITATMQQTLNQLYQQFTLLNKLAEELNLNVGLIIMGSSDNSGSTKTNKNISLKRAENTANTLKQLGIADEKIFTTGLGQLDIEKVNNTSRKVMFNVIYVNK
ncbi:OmpA family protein [Thalassotalea piscium]|uniref:Outer membrane protein OmpA-like peptidoglycan-associated protein n=1 Tax=Thalassotalea piscium TaxID=1230533 RepID=A0A7X0TSY5_9GAMM|nr:OmpA family protein [Thalassotalea piscium]MBB6542672.1 outer membrane protein OmpA-like peptidoglycan-associated protein [Thalassotalea piscium]